MKLSIIIPVYNVAAYIEKCIKSALGQDLPFDEYEIILINDGSPDNSVQIIETYIENYPNITLINQANQGVASARNAGLDAAKGDYIFFLDADDSLYPNALGKIYKRASEDNLDLLYVKIDYFNEAGILTGGFKMDSDKIEILDGFQHQRRGFICGLYKNDCIKNIRFETGIPMGEDALFNIMVHSVAKRVSYSDVPCYQYLVREGSASRSILTNSKKIFDGHLENIDILTAYRNSIAARLSDAQFHYFDRPFNRICYMALQNIIVPLKDRQKYLILKQKLHDNGLDYIFPQVRMFAPYFGSSAFIFFGYVSFRKFGSKVKHLFKLN